MSTLNTTQAKQITQVKIIMGEDLVILENLTNAVLNTLNEDTEHNYLVTVGLTVEVTGGFTLTIVYSYLTITLSNTDEL